MALNFPDPAAQTPVNTWSPTSTPSASTNGLTYLWDGAKWLTQAGVPNLHWTRAGSVLSPTNAGDDVTTTGDVNAANVVATGDVQMASLNSGPLAGFRNLLINPGFEIAQRGLPMTISTNQASNYSFDRWDIRGKAQTGGNTVISSTYSGGVRKANFATTGYTSTGYVTQKIEAFNVRHLLGQTLTLSVYANSTPGVTVNWYNGADAAQSLVAFGTSMTPVAGQADRYSVSFTMPSAAAIASDGTNVGLQVSFWFADTANPVPNGTYSFWEAQLEPGPVATPFEHRPIGTELALCQRYYQAPSMSFRGWLTQTGTSTKNVREQRPVVMRAAPTETGTGTAGTTVVFSGSADMVSITINNTANTAGATVSNYTADAEL